MKTIRVRGLDEEIPVGKILCLGRTYREHAAEMQAEVPDEPIVFLKPSSAIVRDGEEIRIPSISQDLQHEVELVVVIGKSANNITEAHARDFILGVGVGLDMTLRDVQAAAKKKGLPWTVAKGFDTSAPVSEFVPLQEVLELTGLEISCRVNGSIRQHGRISDMIFSVERIIAYLSTLFTLERGDLIFTGTPHGVGRVVAGDTIEAELVGFTKTTHRVGRP